MRNKTRIIRAVVCSFSAVCIQVGAVFIACRYSTLSVAMATGEVIWQQNMGKLSPLAISNDNEWDIKSSTWLDEECGEAATLSCVDDMKQTRRVADIQNVA